MIADNFPSEDLLEHLDDLLSLRNKFAYDYSVETIKKLTLDEYCEHAGDKSNFCYRLEHELEEMGHINVYAAAFGVKYDKDIHAYRGMKKYSKTEDPDEALAKIKKEIIALIHAGADEDYSAIRNSMIAPNIRYKILAVYYPDRYITVFAEWVLRYFCEKLDIPCEDSDDTLILQDKLVMWKNQQKHMQDWSLLVFVKYLYLEFDRPESGDDISVDSHKKKLKTLKKEIDGLTEKISKASEKTVLTRQRDEKIRAYALERAHGVCQLCGNLAPFYKKNGEPYLESHHIIPLAENGSDSIYNVVGLCPNCHRKMHSLKLAEDIKILKSKVAK